MPDLARVPLGELLAQLENVLVGAFRRGATRAQAAAVVGLAPDRLGELLARGERPDAPPALAHLAQSVRAAEAAYELRLLDALTGAALAGDRAAAVWLLERRAAGGSGAPPAPSDHFTGDDVRAMTDEQLSDVIEGRPPRGYVRGQGGQPHGVVILPPEDPEGSAPLVQRDLERMTGEQLRALVRQGRLMPAGPAIYIPPEADE